MMEAEMRAILAYMAQAMANQTQFATVQAQAMTSQANQEISPRPYQQVTTMASRLRDSLEWTLLLSMGQFDEDHQEFIDEVYKILYVMGVSSSERAELATYQLKNVAQTWYVKWSDNRPLRGGPVT